MDVCLLFEDQSKIIELSKYIQQLYPSKVLIHSFSDPNQASQYLYKHTSNILFLDTYFKKHSLDGI